MARTVNKCILEFLLQKQNELFKSRLIQANYIIDDQVVRQFHEKIKDKTFQEIVEKELNLQIAEHIGAYIETAVMQEFDNKHRMYKRCMVMNMKELKHIVDLLVKTIPIEELAKIRNTDLATLEQQLSQF